MSDNKPPEKWSTEKPFDSSEYLDGPPPRVMTPEELKKFKSKGKKPNSAK